MKSPSPKEKALRIDERNHVEKPLLDGLQWEVIDLDAKQHPKVIVHELAHLLEANHTPRFWNIVRTKLATTERAKAWLKEHGQILEQGI